MRHVRKYRRKKHETALEGELPGHVNTVDSARTSRNIVRALFEHFQKWKPEALSNARSIQEMCCTRTEEG